MRLMINSRFLTQPITGVQRYAHEITREIIKSENDEVIVLAPQIIKAEYQRLYPITNSCSPLSGHPWEQFALPCDFKKANTQLLFSPGNMGPLCISDQVVTLHDTAFITRPDGFKNCSAKWYGFLIPRLAKKVKKIITVSHFAKNELVENLKIPAEKIVTIYNGVGEKFKPQPLDQQTTFRSYKGLPERYILALGSIGKNKNYLRLLRAWGLLAGEVHMQNVFLVIAGGIADPQAAYALTELSVTLPRVLNIGYIEEESLPQLYSGAEALIHPSLYEGFGLPPLEAMACGTPVIVSKAASLPEVVGDAGMYFDPYDIEDIARSIYNILTNKGLQHNLLQQGLERAKLFNWEKSAGEALMVLKAAASDKRS